MSSGHKDGRDGRMRVDGPLALRHNLHIVGSGSELVVFAHGLGTDQSVWREIVAHLPSRYAAILLDLPGASPLLPDDYDPDEYRSLAPFADDLLNLLDEIGVDRCIYIGHSVAGMIGVLAAIEQPTLFRRLVLLNASPRYLNDVGYVGGFQRADIDGMFDAMAANYQAWVAGFAPFAIGDDVPEAVEEFSSGLLAMRPDVTLRIARTIFESDVRELLPSLTVPTLLIHSTGDPAVPEPVAHFLHDRIAGSELVWIDAIGHLPHLSAPHAVRAALSDVLAD